MSRRQSLPRGLLALVALGGLLSAAPPIQAQPRASFDELERESTALAERMARLHETYIQPIRMATSYSVDSRFADGRLLYLLGDYGRASIVFLDIVENAPQNNVGFFEARYYLAESLFASRNLTAARGYYREILDDPRDPGHTDAVRRLLEIAFETRNFTGLDTLYDQLQRAAGGSMRPDIIYIRAKTLYFGGDHLAALREFERIPGDSEYFARARYFAGTSYVQLERWEEATAAFQSARDNAATTADGAEAAEVADLAALALGRVYYELDDALSALESYQAVSRTSPHYDRALYEMCWAYQKNEQYEDALRTLEILMLAVPDSRFLPRAQLLRGDLLLRLSRYDNAQGIFESTVDQFGPLERQLASVIGRESDPEQYFSALIDSASASLMLPNLAREWVEDDESMRRALALVGDLEMQGRELRESREIIEDIETVLSSSARLDVFPELRQGYGHALEAQYQTFGLRSQLVDAEADRVRPTLDERALETFATLRDERVRLGQELAVLPSTVEDMSAAERSAEGRIQALATEVYRQSYEIQTQRAQMAAMRLMLREEVASGQRSLAEAEQLEADLDAFARQLDRLGAEQNGLRRELEEARLSTGLGSVTAVGRPGLLVQYELALRREEDYLGGFRAGLSDRDALLQIDRVRDQLVLVQGEIDRFVAEVDRLVTQQTGDITRQITVESALLDEYERLLRTYGQQGERLAGEVAFVNFIEVQDQFHDLILQADVGIIDVAWRQKEDRTDRIDELFDARNQELDVLDVEFREVLQDE